MRHSVAVGILSHRLPKLLPPSLASLFGSVPMATLPPFLPKFGKR
jgi:hypothetical protein